VWHAWFEANNARSTSYNRSGYSFSQFKFDNVARVQLTGHTGWRQNQARLNRFDRVRNELIEERNTTVSTTVGLELVTAYEVTADVALPDGTNSNWSTVWTNASYRPTAQVVGSGTENDPERIRITWPADCFNNVDSAVTAYWRPFNAAALVSPASFYYTADVVDVDGNLSAYCIAREAASAERQRPFCGAFAIAPVAGAITAFPLWDQNRRIFSGSIDIDDTRTDIQPEFQAWFSGMDDDEAGGANSVGQTTQHIMDIYNLRLYRIT
jgi:hypothetical protein